MSGSVKLNDFPHLLPDTLLQVYCIRGQLPLRQGFPDGFLGNWEESGFSFLFFLTPAHSFIEALLRADGERELIEHHTMTYGQWQGGSVAPVKAGTITLQSPWMEPSAEEDGKILRLDAGIVFGDGMHPTSVTCIEAMERICTGGRISSMLDLGTGSGVLALAAVQCGCSRAIAVDNNFLAARTARKNVQLNGFEKEVLVVTGLAETCTTLPAELLVANIHHEIMCMIIETVGFLEKKRFILSGLQHHEADDIMARLANKPVDILERIETGAVWQTIVGAVDRPR